MTNLFRVVTSLFNNIFVVNTGLWGNSFLSLIIQRILALPYLFIGIVFVIIGFTVSILKRIIHS